MTSIPNWTEALTLRPEVIASDGGVGELQMSLHKAVYQTVDVPYREVNYYSDITQPTPNLIGFFSRIARRLGGAGESTALYHLDQGMGGGKSHALVGLFHMANEPERFFATPVGRQVLDEAEASGAKLDVSDTRVVTLTADNFSPGRPSETFGPASDLFGRFLWALFAKNRALFDKYMSKGANKETLRDALAEVGGPVLILLDELMDYVMELSDAKVVDTMPGEKAFLNALADACDDVERVAFVVVMIRSELDQEGYTPLAEDFRTYIAKRLERNGTKQAVTETGDFSAIIRRRIFEQTTAKLPAAKVAKAFQQAIHRGSRLEHPGVRPVRQRQERQQPRRPHCGNLPIPSGSNGPCPERMGQGSGLPTSSVNRRHLCACRSALDANRSGRRMGSSVDRRW